MTTEQLLVLQSEVELKKKSKAIMYILWVFLGVTGAHRFYLGDFVRGIFMLCTFGGLGFWALIDVFFIGRRLAEKTRRMEDDMAREMAYRP